MPDMKRSDPVEHLPLPPLELHVLLVLMEGDLHGYGLAKEIESRETGIGRILPTNLYRRLRDLTAKGIICETSDPTGTKKKLFGITTFGKRVAKAEALRLEAVVAGARQLHLLPAEEG